MILKVINYFLAKKFFRFAISGAVATVADMALLFVLTEFVHLWYLLSATFGFILGTVVHYLISSSWVFQNQQKKIQQYIVFVLVQIIGLLINLTVIYILVEKFATWYILAKIIAVFFGFLWNFFANLKITFKNSLC